MNSELLLVVIPSTVLGIFQDSFRASSYRTALEAAVEMSEPFVGTARIRDAPGASPTRSFFVRVGVANLGKSAAWRVSILLTRLEKYNEEAPRYEVEEWFVPVEFAWCHGIGSQLQALNPHPPSISIWAITPAQNSLETRAMTLIRLPLHRFS